MFNFEHDERLRKALPIYDDKSEIIRKIDTFPVTIISGPTGCGKSTQIPQFILDYHADTNQYVNIIVTQPRRLAAQSVAKRVCMERGWNLGRLVGYKVGLDKSNASKDTRLMYVTTGVLIKMLINKKNMSEYTHVIIDEVHERDKDMDFLLILTKKFLTSNSKDTKIILMSATLNEEKLLDYYRWSYYGEETLTTNATVYDVQARAMYKNYVFYLDDLRSGPDLINNIKYPHDNTAFLSNDCISVCCQIMQIRYDFK